MPKSRFKFLKTIYSLNMYIHIITRLESIIEPLLIPVSPPKSCHFHLNTYPASFDKGRITLDKVYGRPYNW